MIGLIEVVGVVGAMTLKPIGIKQAMARYDIQSMSTWSKWLETAGVESFRVGKYTFIRQEDLEILDELARKMKRRINTEAGVIEAIEAIEVEQLQQLQSPNLSITLTLQELAQLIQSRPIHPFENLLLLEEIAQHGWQMRSKELAPLIGWKSLPASPFEARGFLFQRNGSWWKVSKLKE